MCVAILEDGRIAGDMVFDVNESVDEEARSSIRQTSFDRKNSRGILSRRFCVRLRRRRLRSFGRRPLGARRSRKDGERRFTSRRIAKRFLNPHSYPVGLEAGLWHRRASMAAALRESKA
ncbi:MAG: hypothetical protein ACLTQI_00755 [Slackia sp.]